MIKPEIRSLTIGVPLDLMKSGSWEYVAGFLDHALRILRKKEIPVRTLRVTLSPVLPPDFQEIGCLFAVLDSMAHKFREFGIRWFCLPIDCRTPLPDHSLETLGPLLIRQKPEFFIHFLFAGIRPELYPNLRGAAEAVLRISRLSNNGYDNFRVGTGFNILPNTPFYPFSWNDEGINFSFAVEVLDQLLRFSRGGDRISLLENMTSMLSEICSCVDDLASEIETPFADSVHYKGQDISIAPFPNEFDTVVNLFKKLGLRVFGACGTLSITAMLTQMLKCALNRSSVKATGFNGVMFSPLEDTGIAWEMIADSIPVSDFMLWSTVCGCGIDMIPIPGDTSPAGIQALYSDVATISDRFNKPLGVRILPIPGKRVNQLTDFNHDFLVNCPITPVTGMLTDSCTCAQPPI